MDGLYMLVDCINNFFYIKKRKIKKINMIS